jgi:hypothetical protein
MFAGVAREDIVGQIWRDEMRSKSRKDRVSDFVTIGG